MLSPSNARLGEVSESRFHKLDQHPASVLTVEECGRLQAFPCNPEASAAACWAPFAKMIPPEPTTLRQGRGGSSGSRGLGVSSPANRRVGSGAVKSIWKFSISLSSSSEDDH